MCVAQSGHAPDLGVQGRRVGNRSNKQLEIQLCRTHQELRWSWPSSSERRPRFSRPPRSPRIIMIAPIGHPCTLGRASGANRRAMFAAKIRKGSLQRRASDRRTRRTVRAERSPAIVREHQSPGPASGALHSCSKRNPRAFSFRSMPAPTQAAGGIRVAVFPPRLHRPRDGDPSIHRRCGHRPRAALGRARAMREASFVRRIALAPSASASWLG
jgi:hypothetical protein